MSDEDQLCGNNTSTSSSSSGGSVCDVKVSDDSAGEGPSTGRRSRRLRAKDQYVQHCVGFVSDIGVRRVATSMLHFSASVLLV